MNRLEHFKEAERLLEAASEMQTKGIRAESYVVAQQIVLQEAQVHATLACAEVPGR